MSKGSQGLAKPLEKPGSEQGAARRDSGKSYSQSLHNPSPSKDAPRSLPFSTDAEKGVLCSMLLSPRDVSDLCVLRLQPPAFYVPAHQIIYELVIEFADKSKPIDFITLKQTLQDRGQLEEIGAVEFLNELYGFVPTAANAAYYIDIVREKYLLRRLILTCDSLSGRSYDEQENVEPLMDDAEREILQIRGDYIRVDVVPTKELVIKAIEQIEHLYENRGAVTGLPTGFVELDRMTSGMHPAEMIVIAARPSMGKTAFAMNVAEHVSLDVGKPVGVFSLEMSSQQLVQRLLCSRAKVDLQKVRNGFLSERDFPSLTTAASHLAGANLYIDDTPGLSISELRAKARRLKANNKIELLVIDYLQLLRSTTRRAQDNRQLEISEISGGIKALAKELEIPVIVVAQLNRQPDARAKGDSPGRPRLSDLRESGSIEQDADVVGLLVRPEYYATDEEEKERSAGEAELIIAKQRNGPTGEILLTFRKEYTRFENRAKEHAA
jgi:replicative DNA helicase